MHLLKGKLRTFEGWAMSPSSSGKSGAKRDGTQPASRTLYYCSQKAAKRGYKTCPIKTINATHLDDLVRAAVVDHILLKHRVNLRVLPPPERDRWIRELIHRVVLAPKQIAIELEDSGIAACRTSLRLHPGADDGCTEGRRPPAPAHHRCLFTPTVTERDGHTVLSIDIALKRHDNRRVLVAPDGSDLTLALATDGAPIPQPHLVRAIGQAFAWQAALLRNRTTMESIAKVAGITPARVAFLLQLTRLSPTVIRAVLTGNAPSNVSLLALSRAATHLDWSVQEATLGVRRR
jgi:hypothetical protein